MLLYPEDLHTATLLLSLTAFFITLFIYVMVSLTDREIHPIRVVAAGLSGVTLEKEFDRFFLLFEGSIILFLTSMLFKYVIDIPLLYKVLEIPAMIVFVLVLSLLMLRYLERRQTVSTDRDV